MSLNKKQNVINFSVCDPNPCEHGKCVDEGHRFTCQCALGYEGKLCDQGRSFS